MATVELKLGGKMTNAEFDDISGEEYRTYEFGEEQLLDGRVRPAQSITIVHPQWLNVSKSGGHRLVDIMGCSHYIPCGWKHLFWKAKNFHFVKQEQYK